MPKNRKKHSVAKTMGVLFLGLTGLALLLAVLLQDTNIALFNPKGSVAEEQLKLILLTTGIMLIIAIPVLFMLYFIAWKYRESNTKATHDPASGHSKLLNVSMWLVPGMFALVLSLIMWSATHRLVPQKQITADAKPLTIQVVAQRWKWLFIYPEQNIATVNYVQIPADTPVTFELTADEAPMSSFWIPNLGGMLYAMNGHVNPLNLIADTPGDYPGSSAEINGAGFAGMKFTARVSTSQDFNQWVETIQDSDKKLDAKEYDKLLKPTENNPTAFYWVADNSGLYDKVLTKYMGTGHDHKPEQYHGGH